MGAHWINCPYWGMSKEERATYEQSGAGKNHNAVWDGLIIRATREIRPEEEILLDYTPDDQTAETRAVLAQRASLIRRTKQRRKLMGGTDVGRSPGTELC